LRLKGSTTSSLEEDDDALALDSWISLLTVENQTLLSKKQSKSNRSDKVPSKESRTSQAAILHH
jgi:hypothetical protein